MKRKNQIIIILVGILILYYLEQREVSAAQPISILPPFIPPAKPTPISYQITIDRTLDH